MVIAPFPRGMDDARSGWPAHALGRQPREMQSSVESELTGKVTKVAAGTRLAFHPPDGAGTRGRAACCQEGALAAGGLGGTWGGRCRAPRMLQPEPHRSPRSPGEVTTAATDPDGVPRAQVASACPGVSRTSCRPSKAGAVIVLDFWGTSHCVLRLEPGWPTRQPVLP